MTSGFAKNISLAAGAVLLFYGLAEVASRVLHPVPLPEPVETADRLWIPPNDRDYLLFWKMRPNSGENGKPVINALGLRGPLPAKKNSGEFRILSLGESTTFGWKVRYEATYSQVLEDLLGRVDGRSARVVNAGVPAYTSFQGLEYLRHRGLDLEPDAVLIYFGANDFTPLSFRTDRTGTWAENRGMTDPQIFRLRQDPLVRISTFLLEYSNLYRALAMPDSAARARTQPESTGSRLSGQDRLDVLNGFRDLTAALGIRLVILVPWYREFTMHEELLRRFAGENGVDLIDLPALLTDLPENRADYFLDITHPTERGHAAIGSAIDASLRSLWDAPAE